MYANFVESRNFGDVLEYVLLYRPNIHLLRFFGDCFQRQRPVPAGYHLLRHMTVPSVCRLQ